MTPLIPTAHAGLILFVCVGLATTGCKNRRADKEPVPTNAGLASLATDKGEPTIEMPEDGFADTRRQVEQSAALLEEALSEQAIASVNTDRADDWKSVDSSNSEESNDVQPETRFSLLDSGSSDVVQIDPPAEKVTFAPIEPDQAVTAEIVPVEPFDVAEESVDPEVRKQELVDELVGLLSGLARTGDEPGAEALALAGLETLRPQALDELKNEGLLSNAELASLDAARRVFDALQTKGGIADPAQVSEVLERIRQDLVANAGLRIARAELCTSVAGYGRFETFGVNRFIAGRAQEVIVYSEVDGFQHRETTGPDGLPRYEIELTQRLELYHTADDLNTWNRAAETDRTVSRNRQRDYYLLNQVVLPANLTIGKYHLKVVMRDLVGGTLAESIIPIEIVAGTRAGALP
ncbi:MAG: hypothetical protein AB8F26_13575 [Phycisphaerales bacterium]